MAGKGHLRLAPGADARVRCGWLQPHHRPDGTPSLHALRRTAGRDMTAGSGCPKPGDAGRALLLFQGTSYGIGLLIACRAVLGAVTALFLPELILLLADVSAPERRTVATSLFAVGQACGRAFGILAGGLTPWRVLYLRRRGAPGPGAPADGDERAGTAGKRGRRALRLPGPAQALELSWLHRPAAGCLCSAS